VRRGRKATGLIEIAGLPWYYKGSRVALENRVPRLFGVMADCSHQYETSNNLELKMEFSDLLIFAIIIVVAYIIFKVIDKKMGPKS
jgi:hypothetical protein